LFGFELVVALLCIAVVALPVFLWVGLRRIAKADQFSNKKEELHAIENSISLMVKEIQDSVDKALEDMDEAAKKLNSMIETADDRIRQLEYYYEYGDELKPLIQANNTVPATTGAPISEQQPSVSTKSHALKHREVHELSRKGWSAPQIARHTGMSSDEVQLIINLMEISTVGSQSSLGLSRQPML
jgi:hypothetical protein